MRAKPDRLPHTLAMSLMSGVLLWPGCGPVPVVDSAFVADASNPTTEPSALVQSATVTSRESALTGIWAVADLESNETFALFTFDQAGQIREMCHQPHLAYYGIDQITVDGQPQMSDIGLAITAIADVAENGEEISIGLMLTVSLGPLEAASTFATLNARLDRTDEATGTLFIRYTELGQANERSFDVVARRLSDQSDGCLSDDGFEDNDDPLQAVSLPHQLYPDLVSFDDDWYRVDVGDNETLTASIEFDDRYGDLDLFLFDAAGSTLIASSAHEGSIEHLDFPSGAGTYLLKVANALGGIQPSYALDLKDSNDVAGLDRSNLLEWTALDQLLALREAYRNNAQGQ